MNSVNNEISQVQQLFQKENSFFVLIKSYAITHSYLLLALHRGNYPKSIEIGCCDCFYLSGLTAGGPYQLHITIDTDDEGRQYVALCGNKTEFVVKCNNIKIERIRE